MNEEALTKDPISYFIYDGKYIKIGMSSNGLKGVYERLKQLQTSSPRRLHLIACSKTPEAELHEMFKASRLVGEWFNMTPAMLHFLASPKCYTTGRRKNCYFKEWF